MLALFFLDIFIESLDDLLDQDELSNSALLQNLTSVEHDLHQELRNIELPEWTTEGEVFFLRNFTKEFWLDHSVCRTARLPAQSRYLGITTNTNKVGPMAPVGQELFDIGVPMEEAIANKDSVEMQLTYDPSPDEREVCDVLLKPDYKDYFLTHRNNGSQKMFFPNKKEKQAYGYDAASSHGMLVAWFGACDWGQCPEGDLHPPDLLSKADINVNNRKVVEFVDVGLHGWLLVGKTGPKWETDEQDGFTIQIRVKEKDSYVRLMTLVVL